MKRTFINFQYAPRDNGGAAVQAKDERQPVTLREDDLDEQLSVISTGNIGTRNAGAENEEEFTYSRIAWTGNPRAFTMPDEIAALLKAGELYSVTLKPSSFTQPILDEEMNETGENETVNNYVYGNHVTIAQKVKREEGKDQLRAIGEKSEDRKIERQLKLVVAGLKPVDAEIE